MPLSLGIASGAGSLKDVTKPELLGYRVNYIPNPSFEVDATGWASVNSASINTSSAEFFSGSNSLEVINSSQSGVELSSRIPFLGGEGDYQVSVYVKVAEGSPEANYYIRYLEYETEQSTGTVTSGNVGTQSLSFTGNWVRISGVMPKTPIAGFFSLRILTNSTTLGSTYYIDAVMVEKADALGDYFDGSSPESFWTGTPNNSYSGSTPY